jgi:hypothetical protein
MPNPFENVKQLFTEEDVEIDSPFMVNRIISFIPETCVTAIRLNRYSTYLPKWAITACFNLCIKKRKRNPWIHYPKRGKSKDNKLRAKIRQVFCVNDYHAEQLIELLKKMGEKPESYFGLKEGE